LDQLGFNLIQFAWELRSSRDTHRRVHSFSPSC
jgi:hypothetical protein